MPFFLSILMESQASVLCNYYFWFFQHFMHCNINYSNMIRSWVTKIFYGEMISVATTKSQKHSHCLAFKDNHKLHETFWLQKGIYICVGFRSRLPLSNDVFFIKFYCVILRIRSGSTGIHDTRPMSWFSRVCKIDIWCLI